MLAELVRKHESALRADLQQYYGIDLDRAMSGEHSPVQVAACACGLQPGSRVLTAIDPDFAWTLTDQLLALQVNHMRWLMYSLGGGKGKEPENIGTSRMKKKKNQKKLDAQVMTVDALMAELKKPRKAVRNGRPGNR